ncbi:hypothetical protein [Nonomuraea jiangxiensis]|uniref:hypothetical protein n=1 Tax=Nonomuraea jiangxiensis TaxID=633440 RepID=UPI00115FC3C3|nr:hypothetical protein [Nonomuraea jiangxiensis]
MSNFRLRMTLAVAPTIRNLVLRIDPEVEAGGQIADPLSMRSGMVWKPGRSTGGCECAALDQDPH